MKFFVGVTHIDEIADQDHDEGSQAGIDVGGLGW